jgi:cytidine deaminase
MCRQFIREFCDTEMKIWMYGARWDRGERDSEQSAPESGSGKAGNARVVEVKTIGELLPMSFGRADLERGTKPQ